MKYLLRRVKGPFAFLWSLQCRKPHYHTKYATDAFSDTNEVNHIRNYKIYQSKIKRINKIYSLHTLGEYEINHGYLNHLIQLFSDKNIEILSPANNPKKEMIF